MKNEIKTYKEEEILVFLPSQKSTDHIFNEEMFDVIITRDSFENKIIILKEKEKL